MRLPSGPVYNSPPAPATGSIKVEHQARPTSPAASPSAEPRPQRRVYRWLAWLVSGACLALLLVWVPLAEVVQALGRVSWGWLALAAVFTLVNLGLRGWRWALIVDRRGHRWYLLSLHVCTIGVGLNAVLPGKAGELARIALAARHLRLRIGRVVAAALAERLIDLLVLLLLVAMPLTQVATVGDDAGVGGSLTRLARNLAFGGLVLAGGLVLLSHRDLNRRLRRAMFGLLAGRFSGAARGLHRSLVELRRALVRVASASRLAALLGLTLLMWLAVGAGVYLAVQGSPAVALSLPLAVAFAAVTVLAAALPSAPGAWGVFEAAGVVFLIALTGVEDLSAVFAFVVAVHLMQYVSVVAAATASWLLIGRLRPGPGRVSVAGG